MTDYEQTYEDFWKGIVEVNGVLDPDKVKRELHDYRTLLRSTAKVYSHVTGGRISKQNTDPDVVCSEADDHYDRICDPPELPPGDT